MTSNKIRPLQNRVVVERLDEERTSAGGIVIPSNATEKPICGKVIAVGAGKILENGDIQPLDVKIDNIVLFSKYAGSEIIIDNEAYLIMREDDILAIVE